MVENIINLQTFINLLIFLGIPSLLTFLTHQGLKKRIKNKINLIIVNCIVFVVTILIIFIGCQTYFYSTHTPKGRILSIEKNK